VPATGRIEGVDKPGRDAYRRSRPSDGATYMTGNVSDTTTTAHDERDRSESTAVRRATRGCIL